MKKVFNYYSVIWAVLFVLYNIISFASVGWAGVEKYTPSFWVGYILITLAFIGQIICTYFGLKDSDRKKTFYNISLITTSYTGLIISFVFGGLCMLVSSFPYWAGIILSAIVLACNVIAVVKASAAIDLVNSVDEKVKANTFFIKSLTVDAESLVSRAKSEAVQAECKQVCEAVRYSDPVSSKALASIEREITIKFAKLSDAVVNDESESACKIADELILLLGDRNKKSHLLK